MDWGEMFRVGLALTLLMEAPGEIQDFKDGLRQPTENLVCYSFEDKSTHLVEENVRELHYNPTDRSWTFVHSDGGTYRLAIADTATCWQEEG